MNWESTKLYHEPLTRELAAEFAQLERLPGSRPLSDRRLRAYAKLAAAGGFRTVSWAKVFCKETDRWYCVDGRHTSTLFSTLEPLPEIFVVVEEFACETMLDVARLNATFDAPLQARLVAAAD